MNMLEALKVAYDNPETIGARPASWKGLPSAIFWSKEAKLFIILMPNGASPAPIPGEETWKEWETVSEDVVEKEIQDFLAQNKPHQVESSESPKVSDK